MCNQYLDQQLDGMAAIRVIKSAEAEIEQLKTKLLHSQSIEEKLRRGILLIDDCICNDREDEALLLICNLMHETENTREFLAEYRDSVIEHCAELCDQQHDKARTEAGAARADACATSIRKLKQ